MRSIGSIAIPDFPLLLAPAEDVSDPLFRAVCRGNGADLILNGKIIRDVVLL
jgi:tRNA-dihydrouridine synthase B